MILQDGKYNGKQVVRKSSIIRMQQNYAKGAKVISSPAEVGSWGYGFGEWVMNEPNVRSQGVTSPGLFGSFPWVDNEKNMQDFILF